MAKRGINLVVIRSELDYKLPLISGDEFYVQLNMEQVSPLRFCFNQEIRRKIDDKLSVNAKIFGTAINEKGRPQMPEEIKLLLEKNSK